jgi:membrane associated rhomboid family serine protease
MEASNPIYFILIYILSVPLSLVYNFYKWRNSYSYTACGASGAVCALLFAFIISNPTAQLLFFIIPMPAWLFGLIFIGVSLWLIKSKKMENIGHDVHITGAVVGALFAIIGMMIGIC